MALNISRFFKRTPEVAAGDINGDGVVDGHDAAAGRGAQPSGVMQDYYAHSNVMADGHEGDMASHEAARAAAGQTHNAVDAGFSISDDALDAARTAQGGLGARGGGLGVKWEGPDYDASKGSLITEVGFPKVEGTETSFTSAEGRSMSFELLKADGPDSGATERTMGPGGPGQGAGLRDMEIDLGHGGTLNHAGGPDAGASGNSLLTELKFPAADGYTATDDLWKFRGGAQDGSGTDNANRTMGPGHQGSGFMMQDGELYPRGIEGAAGPLKWGAPGREASNYASIEFASLRPERGSNDIELRTALSEAQDGSGTDNANRTAGPGHQGSGFMMQDGELYPRARGFDSDDPQATSGAGNTPGHDDGPDTGAIRDIILKRGEGYTATDDLWKFRGENTEARHDAPGGLPARDLEGQMAGFHTEIDGQPAGVLPEVNDEVLVSFSALEADADAPTTLVDLHSHGVNADGLIGHVEIPHLDPGHHDLGGGHHGHGFMDYTDDAAIDN